MPRDAARAIAGEQIKVLYRQARVVFVPNTIATPIIMYVLWLQVPQWQLWAWGICMYSVTALRAWVVWLYHRQPRTTAESLKWGWLLAAINAFSGLGWGMAAFLFASVADPLALAFVIVTVAAMVSGAVSSLSAFLPAYVVFAVMAVVPMTTRTLLEWQADRGGNGTTWLLLGVLTVVYLVVHLVFARVSSRALAESIRLRFENLELVEQLTVQKERAEAVNVAKTRFLAAASHDLRQPIHALGLFIDALRSEPHEPRSARILERVVESHETATGLLDNILEFSKVDAGVTNPSISAFPVQRLLDQMRSEYAVQASAADLDLRVRPCAAFVRSDPVLLARLLGNLISNAIRYTEEGRILIGCRHVAGKLRIEVHDTGIGIPPDQHQFIFREFYQVEDGARRGRAAVGMGLGLAIVSGLAQALGHPVTVASTPGRGSTFTVTAPIATAVATPQPSNLPLSDNLRGKIVLVIDDDALIRDAVAEVLVRWGCAPVAASSAEEAAEMFRVRGGRPDAMIVDYHLGQDELGLEAIAYLNGVFKETIPAVIVTGDTHPERLREANEIGYPLLSKPLAPMRLRAALSSALSSSRA